MNEPSEEWETHAQQVARAFPYPPTPDLAARLRQRRAIGVRRVAQVAAAFVLSLVALLAVPEIRAQVVALFRIGAVEIVLTTATPPARFDGQDMLPSSVLDYPGATTLEDARQHAGYAISLPAALGSPDRVFLVQAARPMVVLAWLNDEGNVDVSLHLLPPSTYSLKMYEGDLEETEVNGEPAVWLPETHWMMLRTGSGDYNTQNRLVSMHALIWEAPDAITYRLETNHPLEAARQIAESIPAGNAQSFAGVLDHGDSETESNS